MPRVSEMFAFVCADKNEDDEGVMAMRLPTGEWAPMVGADMARVSSLWPIAQRISEMTGKPFKCLKFSLEGEVESPDAPASP